MTTSAGNQFAPWSAVAGDDRAEQVAARRVEIARSATGPEELDGNESPSAAIRAQQRLTVVEAPGSAAIEPGQSPETAPLPGWQKLVRDTLWVGQATLVGHLLGAVTSLALRSLLDPSQMGIWQALKQLLSYGNYANLGVSKAAAQELSRLQGSKTSSATARTPTRTTGHTDETPATARVGQYLDLAHTANCLSSLVVALLLLLAAVGMACLSHDPWAGTWSLGLVAVAALTLLQRHVTFRITLLRARQRFRQTSRINLVEAVLSLIVTLCGVWLWGLTGLYLSTAVVLLATWWYTQGATDRPLQFAWDRAGMARLLGLGLPLLSGGVASSLFRSLDKWMILALLPAGEFQLGCYSMALLAGSQLYGLANMLSTVMTPRYSEAFGHTGQCQQVAQLAARASILQALGLLPVALLGLIVSGPFLSWWLPDYLPGLPAIGWTLASALVLGLALPCNQALIAMERGWQVVRVLLGCSLLLAMGIAAVVRFGSGGLEAVSLVCLVVNSCYWFLLARLALWPELTTVERRRYGLLCGTVASVILPATWLVRWLHTRPELECRTGLAVLLVLTAVGGLVAIRQLLRSGSWPALWRETTA